MVLHSPPRTMVSVVVMVVVTLLLFASCPGLCESPVEYDDDYDGDDGCHPEEADHCFADVNDNLLCNFGKLNGERNCTNRDAQDLCDGMRDALACTEDILDSCTEAQGYDTFEEWLTGLRGVYRHLCHHGVNLEQVNVLLEGSKCFRLKRFLNCVEERADVAHMADLLTTDLDLLECNKLQVSVGACIEDGEKNRRQCKGISRVVSEALVAFFTSTACGQPPSPPPQTPPPLPPCSPTMTPGSSNNNTSSTSTTTTTNTTKTNSTSTSNEDRNTITTNTNNTPKDTTTTTTTTSTSTTRKASPQVSCKKDLNTSGTPTASTVVVTVLVTLVLVGLAAMLLLKKGVLVIRTDLDRRLVGLNDDDGNSAYDRF